MREWVRAAEVFERLCGAYQCATVPPVGLALFGAFLILYLYCSRVELLSDFVVCFGHGLPTPVMRIVEERLSLHVI